MPGVTTRKSLPQASRTRATSCGEATTPSAPAPLASTARRRTPSATDPLTPMLASVCSSWLVRMVMARRRMPIAGRAPTAASSISLPPSACTSTRETPSWPAPLTAPATVFGMSWNLRSRKTFSPRAITSRTKSGPAAVKIWLPILNMPTWPASWSTIARAVRGILHVESDDETVARGRHPPSSSATGRPG